MSFAREFVREFHGYMAELPGVLALLTAIALMLVAVLGATVVAVWLFTKL